MQVHAINLDRRADRWARLLEIQAQTPGVEFVRYRADATQIQGHAWLGCTLSHQAIVFEARLRGDPFVLVAEDDLEFTPAFDVTRYMEQVERADRLGYGALYGGTVSYADQVRSVEHKPIIRTDHYLSSHFTTYFEVGYEVVLSWPFGACADYNPGYPLGRTDQERLYIRPPRYMKRGLLVPFVAIQRDGWSDNCNQNLELAATWRDAEHSWRCQ